MVKVCNVCLGAPDYKGSPQVENTRGDKSYLFAPTYQGAELDLCKGCLENLQHGRWDKLAESAHDVLLLRLGAKDGPLAK